MNAIPKPFFKRIAVLAGLVAASFGTAEVQAYTSSQAPDLVVYLAGAAQTDKLLFSAVSSLVSSNVDYYNATSAGVASDANGKAYLHWAVYGDANAADLKVTASTPKLKVLFVKNSEGGAVGTFPLVQIYQDPSSAKSVLQGGKIGTTKLNFIDLSKATGTAPNWTVNPSGTGLLTATQDAGINWGEPDIYRGNNTPVGWSDITAQQASNLAVLPTVDAVIGIVVTRSLRDALQEAQFGTAGPATASDRDKPQFQPSLTRAQVISLVTGQIGKWSDLQVNTANGLKPLTDVANGYKPTGAPFDSKVNVVWRDKDGGIRAAFNALALNSPWSSKPWTPVEKSDPLNGPYAFAENSSNLEAVLNDLENGTNKSGRFANTRTGWGIGLQSLEKNAKLDQGYRFIKIDGVAPTIENVFNGKYDLWATITLQYLKTAILTTDGANKLAATSVNTLANKRAFITALSGRLGSLSALASFNAKNASHPDFGLSGYLATPEVTAVDQIPAKFDASKPVNIYTYGSPTNHSRAALVYKTVASPSGTVDGKVPFNSLGAGSAPSVDSW